MERITPVRRAVASLFAALVAAAASAAAAQDRITLQVGYSPGGSYDMMARVVADHLGAHLEGSPQVLVENVPGAGSLKLARLFAETAPADGSQLASVSSALALTPVFEPENPQFDPRSVRYVAAMSSEASFCVTHKSSGIDTFEAFLASDAKVGSTGKSSSTYTYPAAIKAAFGASFDIVTGFEGGEEIDLAMERGDIQARCGISVTSLRQGDLLDRVNVIAELSPVRKGTFEGATFALDALEDPARRAALELVFSSAMIHHPIIVPGGTPEDVLAALRAAVEATAADPAFLAEAERRGIEVTVTPGAEVEARIAGFAATDPAVQEMARQFVQ